MNIHTRFAPLESAATGHGISAAVVAMINQIKPSVVQVRSSRRGAGAGIIWRADGGILTNYHVVAASRGPLQVSVSEGRTLDARVVNHNAELDLALLEVAASDLPAAPIGDSSQLRVGELVFAIGHPLGQPDVVTAGIVSALGEIQVRGTNRTAQYLRSDVRLLPGNSGGPLINAQGAVVGINAMVFGGDLSVAIPSHVASNWVAGPPSRPVYLGVTIQPVELPTPAATAQPTTGLMVVGVQPGGPAERATLMVGDVLLDVDGTPVDNTDTLLGILSQRSNGSTIRLNVLRGGSAQMLDAEVGTAEQAA